MKESEIRPEALFNEFLVLAERDTKFYFSDTPYTRIHCPACDSRDSSLAFHKHGFNYELCPSCDTLFVNPRPSQEIFKRYYREAPSIKFWATNFYKETEEARREHIFRPRAHMVMERILKFSRGGGESKIGWIADVGAGYGVFCQELQKIAPDGTAIFAIEPSPDLAHVCKSKGFTVLSMFLEEIAMTDLPIGAGTPGVLTSFELIEHVQDPKAFLEACRRLLSPEGLLIITTLNGLGFDIQVLWEKSKSVHPPHHINFFNPASIKTLLRRAGFQPLDVSTPGKLDVNILENSLSKTMQDRFWTNFFKQLGEDGKNQFQQFLVDHGISSHMMVVAQCL